MKSKREKTGRIVLRVSLILMVLTSIALSAYIWGSDSRVSRIEQTSSNSPNKEFGQKSLRDIYVPTQVFYYEKSQLYQIYDGNNNLPLEFKELTKSLTKNIVHPISQKSSTYRKMLRNQNYMQLTYPDQITMPLFLTSLNKADSREFNRFFVPVKKDKHELYLGNDLNNKLYKIDTNISFQKLYKEVKNATTKMPVSFARLKDGYSVIYEKAPEMEIYNYLTYEESDSYFAYRLLGSGSPTQRTTGGTTTYANGSYQRLIAANSTHNYEFVDYQQNTIPKLMTSRLMDSLYYVRKIGLSEPDLRFFDADEDTFMYQNFVEEYPIFLPGTYNARAQVKFAKNGMTINFNSLDLQIPVPNNNNKKSLQPTEEVLERLEQAGYKRNEINRIVVGYTVSRNDQKADSHKLVTLEPTYYVKIDNRWRSVDDWIDSTNLNNKSNIKEGLINGL